MALGTASKRAAALACLELQLEAKRFVDAARTAITMNDPKARNHALMSLIERRKREVLLQELHESDAYGEQQTRALDRATAEVGLLKSKLLEVLLINAPPGPAIAHVAARGAACSAVHASLPVAPSPSTPSAPPCSDPFLATAIEAFISERMATGAWTAKTSDTGKARLRLLLDWFGNVPVSSVSRGMMTDFLNGLKRLPRHAEKRKESKGLGMRAQTQLVGMDCISPSTVNLIMESVSGLFAWMDADKTKWKINGNVAKGLQILKTEALKRIPFDDDDMRAMFSLPEWKTKKFLNSYAYWLIPLASYTGARINELCQIRLTDFGDVHGNPVVSICSDGLRHKNRNAIRTIPIHPELVRLGLLRYVERLRLEGHTQLFPECVNKRDGHGQDASRWFGKFKLRAGILDARKVFHSIRHGFSTQLHNAGVDRSNVIAPLMGHAGAGESDRTYWNVKSVQPFIDAVRIISHPLMVKLVPVVEEVTFGIDVHRLNRRPPVRKRAPARTLERRIRRSEESVATVE